MEQIAVYIIIIVILILSSLRKGKKQQQAKLDQLKRQKEIQEQQTSVSVSPIDEIFKQFGGDFFNTDFEQPQPVVSDFYQEKISQPTPFLDNELKQHAKKQSIRNRETTSFKSQKNKEIQNEHISVISDDYEHFENELSTIEEFRKAIIYSEIINRKYE